MSSVLGQLSAPVGSYKHFQDKRADTAPPRRSNKSVPAYGRRNRFVPRSLEDFGDGGAFPEIHVAQYPLNMGKPGVLGQGGNILTTYTDSDGVVHHDTNVRAKGKTIYSKFTDLIERVEQDGKPTNNLRATDEEIAENTNDTLLALQKIVNMKVKAALPVKKPDVEQSQNNATYIRYTPKPSAPGYNPNCKQRIIRMVDLPVDPMEPPKFKHKKVPGGPPSPPVPVMHSPPRKVTVEDQKNWKIPPCISNWKNARGYTIPLDKRLAADGRGLQETTINPKFGKFAESLYQAEKESRKEVELRSKMRKQLQIKAKRIKEQELVQKANEIRREAQRRQDGGDSDSSSSSSSSSDSSDSSDSDSDSDEEERGGRNDRGGRGGRSGREERGKETEPEREDRQERDEFRYEQRRKRETDLRRQRMGKRSKLLRDKDRDVSERIALGMPTGNLKRESQYDARLFNQSSGMDAGFGNEDEYNVYSKQLFQSKSKSIYRPRANDTDAYGTADEQYNSIVNTDRFKPNKDFKGVDRSKPSGPRSQPVQFEIEKESDPFGVDDILSKTKPRKRKGNALDAIGRSGHMRATGGMGSKDSYESGSSRSKVDFERSRSRSDSGKKRSRHR